LFSEVTLLIKLNVVLVEGRGWGLYNIRMDLCVMECKDGKLIELADDKAW
jgi:hypothetical protein